MAPICPDFNRFGYQVPDPIQNPDHLQPNLFLEFEIKTSPDFKSPLYDNFTKRSFWTKSNGNEIYQRIFKILQNLLTWAC